MGKKLAICVMWLAVVAMAAGCSSISGEQRQGCLIGAGVGAVAGGGLGAAVAASSGGNNNKAYEIGVPVGVAAGALIGALAGCFIERPVYQTSPPPPPPPPPAPPEQPAPAPQKIILRGVHFNFNKSYIRTADKPVLDEAAETLKANPNVKIYVNGYCDAIGSAGYNMRLSQRRADSVATYLEDQGIPSSQLISQGFGKTNFVAANRTAEGRAENRRVELVPVDQ